MSLRTALAAMLGFSALTPEPAAGSLALDSSLVKNARKMVGGAMQGLPQTKLRWYLHDLESAMVAADTGDLELAAMLARAMRRDAILAGILATRTAGIVGLPRRFTGDDEICRALEGRDGVRSVFDDMCPPSELTAMAIDGLQLGVALGELVPVEGRDYPVLVRLDPQFLKFRQSENRWYYSSIAGPIPITPGDGRWVLHVDGPRQAPWQNGLWFSLGNSWINKTHAGLHKANWEGKLANPARVAVSPAGAGDAQKQSWWRQVMAWGVNTVFGVTPGYDVKLLESNGRGYEAFEATIAQSEREYAIAIAGQIVTVDGGSGFLNADVHKSIRADLIKSTADALCYTLNTQVIPPWVVTRFGEDALHNTACLEYVTKPPADLKAEADAMAALGTAAEQLNKVLSLYPDAPQVDMRAAAERFGIPLTKSNAAPAKPQLYAWHFATGLLSKNEGRKSLDQPPTGDPRDDKAVPLGAPAEAAEAA